MTTLECTDYLHITVDSIKSPSLAKTKPCLTRITYNGLTGCTNFIWPKNNEIRFNSRFLLPYRASENIIVEVIEQTTEEVLLHCNCSVPDIMTLKDSWKTTVEMTPQGLLTLQIDISTKQMQIFNKLSVHILKGVNFKQSYQNLKPYVKVILNETEAKKTENGIYSSSSHIYSWDTKLQLNYENQDRLLLEVYQSEDNSCIGSAWIDLIALHDQRYLSGNLLLADKSNTIIGQLQVKLSIWSSDTNSPSTMTPSKNLDHIQLPHHDQDIKNVLEQHSKVQKIANDFINKSTNSLKSELIETADKTSMSQTENDEISKMLQRHICENESEDTSDVLAKSLCNSEMASILNEKIITKKCMKNFLEILFNFVLSSETNAYMTANIAQECFELIDSYNIEENKHEQMIEEILINTQELLNDCHNTFTKSKEELCTEIDDSLSNNIQQHTSKLRSLFCDTYTILFHYDDKLYQYKEKMAKIFIYLEQQTYGIDHSKQSSKSTFNKIRSKITNVIRPKKAETLNENSQDISSSCNQIDYCLDLNSLKSNTIENIKKSYRQLPMEQYKETVMSTLRQVQKTIPQAQTSINSYLSHTGTSLFQLCSKSDSHNSFFISTDTCKFFCCQPSCKFIYPDEDSVVIMD